jgi:phospholipase C
VAANFLVCDRWFASVPGATWPNRLYALCGESGGSKDNKKKFGKIDWPLYHFPSFARHLDKRDVDWRWYHARPGDVEPPTIQIADARYLWRFWEGGHYALIDRPELTGQPSFLDDARDGRLPAVAWIDPDFGITKRDLANDDHPPADIRRGQALVRTVCNALMEGPKWERTLLVITYDEHGGFYDHVPPPAAPDDRENMRRYGPRVPAIVVSPYVEAASVCKLTFDHTSIIRTVLQRFCRDTGSGRLPSMGARVDNAAHLGQLLTLDQPRPSAPIPEFAEALAALMPEDLDLDPETQRHYATPRPASMTAEPVLDYEANLPPMNDLQLGLVRAGLERRELGAPPDQAE